MEFREAPAIKLARRIIVKYSLSVPFDLMSLIRTYANLIILPIPIKGVDGVSLNLKVPKKTPTIILNSNLPKTRQLFTLAHELGHIIIPWHNGTIIDEIYNQSYNNFVYRRFEQEANMFAAELLMPKNWILSKFEIYNNDIAALQSCLVTTIGVSDQAAAIRLIETLPPHFVFASERNGIVVESGITNGTYAIRLEEGCNFSIDYYPYIDKYSSHDTGSIRYHWWKIKSKISIKGDDNRSWREILDNILNDIQMRDDPIKFRRSLNGIVGSAHGMVKKGKEYCIESVYSAVLFTLRI